MAAAVAAVQAVMDFVFITVTAGDQQVLAKGQELFCALIGAALGQFSQDAGFGQVGCEYVR